MMADDRRRRSRPTIWHRGPSQAAAVVIAGCILLPSAERATGYLFFPPGREESLPAYRWVASRYRPGDIIYLSHFAEPSFQFYKSPSDWPADFTRTATIHVQPDNLGPTPILDDIKPFAGERRVWVILIHVDDGEFNAGLATQTAFDRIGHPSMTHSERGATVYLYNCAGADSG